VKIAYDNAVAHKIEAGADMFLMPSRYEPCGLNQIYSLRYGTVPIVRATGGLDDTIEAFDIEHGTEPASSLPNIPAPRWFVACARRCISSWMNGFGRRIQLNGMAKDFSWKGSAVEYVKVYAAARTARACRLYPSRFQRLRRQETKSLLQHLIKLVDKRRRRLPQ